VPDDSAGRQAKCPSCGSLCEIPRTDQARYPAAVPPTSAVDESNPYQAPATGGLESTAFASEQVDTWERTGPPWERDGASAASFMGSVREILGAPSRTFRQMRRTGGLGLPFGFGMIGGVVGPLVGLLLQLMIQFSLVGGGAEVFIGIIIGVVTMPIFVAIGLFLYAGITHVMLMVLGGARFGFETTFRVICYASGATNLFSAIPFVGNYLVLILQIVYSIIGIAEAHEISGLKATAAVLIPVAVCIGVSAVFALAVFVLVFGGTMNGAIR